MTTENSTNLVIDGDGNLYEVPAETLTQYRVSAERAQELTAPQGTEDEVKGYYQGGYVVQRGDTLWGISQRLYGDGRLWPALFAANSDHIRNPNLIYPGQVIRFG